jgi:DNA-binding PadR family transcriptional regulator
MFNPMTKKQPRLSPTSYALLGLLARGPQSAYDLNRMMQTSLLRVYWPRAESHVYSEPKKLLKHGLVSEHGEENGARKRTVYTLTSTGRQALADWLEEEGSVELRSQAEFVLKLILANRGSLEAARKTLERSLESSRQDLEYAIAGIEEILGSDDATPGMPWNGIVINLMAETLAARHRWTHQALALAEEITDDFSEEQRQTMGRAAYEQALLKLKSAVKGVSTVKKESKDSDPLKLRA